jgi:hypothetical protein
VPVSTAALAALAGLPEQALLRAVPEFASPAQLAGSPWALGRPRPGAAAQALACARCAAARGAQRIARWHTHEDVVCLRHQVWTHTTYHGPGTQLDLRDHPEVIAANRRHRRLVRRLGRQAVHAAFEDARRICAQWHADRSKLLPGLEERLDSLGCRHRLLEGDPAGEAALYPHAVALARLLGAPAWSGPLLDEHPSPSIGLGDLDLAELDAEVNGRRPGASLHLPSWEFELLRETVLLEGRPGTRRFAAEVRRTVAPGYRWLPSSYYGKCEPLAEWVRDQARARQSVLGSPRLKPPAEVYTDGGLPETLPAAGFAKWHFLFQMPARTGGTGLPAAEPGASRGGEPASAGAARHSGGPLARRCAPLPGESTRSYVGRLRHAGLTEAEALLARAAGDYREAPGRRLAALCQLSGFCQDTLLRALPELIPPGPARRRGTRPPWATGPGCLLCNAARGAAGYAEVWHAPEDVLCLRHRRWTEDLDENGSQLDLSGQPEILAAYRACRRMARARGHDALRPAFCDARDIISGWQENGSYDHAGNEGFNRRMARFLGPDWQVPRDSALAAAAMYPQVIALTRLLVSPYWTDLALRDHLAAGRPDQQRRDRAAQAVTRHRRAAWHDPGQFVLDPRVPDHLVPDVAAGYLLEDGPGLREFLSEVQRTVEPRYKWLPRPARLRTGYWAREPDDPLARVIHNRAVAQLAALGTPG